MKEKINIEIEELRKRIKHKFYWGVWKGYAIEKKMREYAETGKAHDFEGRELSSEEIEFNKRELWINAPERFNKFFPDENPENILRWAKHAVDYSEYCEKHPEELEPDYSFIDNLNTEPKVNYSEEERLESDRIHTRMEELEKASHQRILHPAIDGRVFIMRDYGIQFSDIPAAYHLVKGSGVFIVVFVSVPRWYFEPDEFDDSQTDEELLELQEIEVGQFTKTTSGYFYKESEGFGINDETKKEINNSLNELGYSYLVIS